MGSISRFVAIKSHHGPKRCDEVKGVAASSTLTYTVNKILRRSLGEERLESFCWDFDWSCLVELAARSCCSALGLCCFPALGQCSGLLGLPGHQQS